MLHKVFAASAVACLATSALAEIEYRVVPKPEDSQIAITVTVPVIGSETVVQIPRWSPGHYSLQNNWNNVRDLRATDASGRTIDFVNIDEATWRIPGRNGGTIKLSYNSPMTVADETMHWNGPPYYLYVVGRIPESCTLVMEPPTGWRVAVGLDEVQPNVFTAKNYDVLADNPVTVGKFLEDRYTVDGKPHIIAIRGINKDRIDRQKLKEACEAITRIQGDFFGGLPYNKYVWHFSVMNSADGAGGLEHLTSTSITVAAGLGPRAVGVLSHEFFHLWNVKRIRSKPLGPFDYTELPQTGALWWLEGTTDYYAHSILSRYGYWDAEQLYADILDNLNGQRARAQRLEVSPQEASFRVREAVNGRGNSQGYGVSYYNTGFLVGLCLDIEMLARTGGKRSLDDVTRALWAMNKDDQPGFEEDEIRKQYVRFGGSEIGEFYDRIVMRPGELPVEDQLAKVGLQITEVEEKSPTLGFTAVPSVDDKGMRVSRGNGVLPNGTLIRVLNGIRFDQANGFTMSRRFNEAVANLKPGSEATLQIVGESGEEIKTVSVTETSRTAKKIIDAPNSNGDALRLRQVWLSKRK